MLYYIDNDNALDEYPFLIIFGLFDWSLMGHRSVYVFQNIEWLLIVENFLDLIV